MIRSKLDTTQANPIEAGNHEMNTKINDDPLRYEFDSAQEYQDYDAWFRAKVQEALDSTEPTVPHDEVVAHVRALIAEKSRNAR